MFPKNIFFITSQRALTTTTATIAISFSLVVPVNAHSAECVKSKTPVIETRNGTQLRADAAMRCARDIATRLYVFDSHETAITARVVIEKDFGSWYNRDWGQVDTWSDQDRTPDSGFYVGGGKRAGAVKTINCVPGTYRARTRYTVTGPAGTIPYNFTSDGKKVDCR